MLRLFNHYIPVSTLILLLVEGRFRGGQAEHFAKLGETILEFAAGAEEIL